jgi:hypothetical protein
MPTSDAKVRAWLLEWPLQPLALAGCEVIEVVDQPEIHRVPFGPAWCRAMLQWRDKLLALALPDGLHVHDMHVVVVAYQPAPRAPLEYGAVAVCGQPRQVDVTADADCALPPQCALDAEVVRACFQYDQRPVVVPELSLLFGSSSGSAPQAV